MPVQFDDFHDFIDIFLPNFETLYLTTDLVKH